MKRSLNLVTNSRGSALLIALLLMTFLLVFGFGISQLVVDSIRVERNVIEAGKAYFASEGGVELSLYYRENRLPGYQIQDDDGTEEGVFEFRNGTTVALTMVAAESQLPCGHRDDEWRPVQFQESVSWPLYRWDVDEGRVDLNAFELNFQVDRGDGYPAVNGNALRWKILGIDSTKGHTEAISGLLEYDSNDPASNVLRSNEATASFTDGQQGATFVHYDAYPVGDFLDRHYFNTLILTNVIDLNAQDGTVQSADHNVLDVQLLPLNDDGSSATSTCEYTLIEANGQSANILQPIDVQVKLDTFLPVFHFALYETD